MANGTYGFFGVTTSGGTIDFVGTGPFIITKTAVGSTGTLDDDTLRPGDTFEVSGFPSDTFGYVGVGDDGSLISVRSIGFANTYAFNDTPYLVGEPLPTSLGGNTMICFAAGTGIATPRGERAVEELGVGDTVLTADGRTVPVRFVGRQTVFSAFAGDRARPVRVAAGALGNGLPHRDLVLTADHALILDGLAVTSGALVNGTTIALAPAPERTTYYHVETEGHDVILANGAPAETYVPYVTRRAFDNYAEYTALYGRELDIAEMTMPRIASARMLPAALRHRLAGQSAA